VSVTLADIYEARRTIGGTVLRTPLVGAPGLGGPRSEVALKLEHLQPTGSFKIRGATNKVANLMRAGRPRGLVTSSSGNHGRAVSYAGRRFGLEATVFLSSTVPEYKRRAIVRAGGTVVVGGDSFDAATEAAVAMAEERGLTLVHPFDDPLVIAGQGTIGLEVLEDEPDVETILIPLSGGGLAAGVAIAVKAANPDIRVIGVSMDGGAAMAESVRAGRVVEVREAPTLADALVGGLGDDNELTFPIVRRLVDEFVLLTEEEILHGMAHALAELHLVLEGAGAVGVAAVLANRVPDLGSHAVVILSGGNVDHATLMRAAERARSLDEGG
jgi:threonine dehydratase